MDPPWHPWHCADAMVVIMVVTCCNQPQLVFTHLTANIHEATYRTAIETWKTQQKILEKDREVELSSDKVADRILDRV